MRKIHAVLFTVLMFLTLSFGQAFADDNEMPELAKLAGLGEDSVIVAAVKAENAKGKTMDQIEKINSKWVTAGKKDPFLDKFLKSDCAKHLATLKKSNPALSEAEEIYALDNQGTIVAALKREEQYYWGEEEGFQNAMNGNIHVNDLEIDEDEMEYMIHIFIPVRDGDTVIGALDVGFEAGD